MEGYPSSGPQRRNMSHPSYRGVLGERKGLCVQTVEHLLDHQATRAELAFMYGYPRLRHYRLGHLLLDYEPLPNPPVSMTGSLSSLRPPSSPSWRVVEELRFPKTSQISYGPHHATSRSSS